MKKIMTNEYADRLAHWLRTLQDDFYRPLGALDFEGFTTYDYLTPAQAAAHAGFVPVQPGLEWGHTWEYMWLRGSLTLPEAARGKQIVMDLQLSGEATLFVNGRAFGTRRAEWVRTPHHYKLDNFLTLCAQGGERYALLFEVYAGHYSPNAVSRATGPVMPGAFQDPRTEGKRAKLGASTYGVWSEDAYQLFMDVMTLQSLYAQLPEGDLRTDRVAAALENFTHIAEFEQEADARDASYRAAREALRPALEARNGTDQAQMYAVGNAHLDLAWLWPVQETERKTARTFAQQLRLIARYPDYKFIQSQPASYEMCRARYPELYARIKEAVKGGQWIADGAMYVEPDTNMASGEALIRQLVYGKRFFKEEFGVDSEILWLPDTFGYTAALPQILRGCNVKYLVTQKIFWTYNDGDPFPYHYFTWRGMDGSEVISFLPTSYTYPTDPEKLCQVWNERRQKRALSAFLIPFGYGDGGGGPCRDHIEYIRREKDLQGMPKVRFAAPAEFFADMQAEGAPPNTWDGELYFSAHRGTFTTQALIKKNNRKSEIALREVELFGVLAQRRAGAPFARERLDALWKTLLLNQFHDILPGSSIARVYKEANAQHAHLQAECAQLLDGALSALAQGAGVTVFNPLAWERGAVVALDARFAGGAVTPEGEEIPVLDGRARVTVPAMGSVSLLPAALAPAQSACRAQLTAEGFTLQNERVTARFNALGELLSYADAVSGARFAGKAMNRLEMYKDVPRKFDAWDIDSMYERDAVALPQTATLRVLDAQGLTAAVEVTRALSESSSLTQVIRLTAGEGQIVFETRVQWHELHRLLKARFDGGVRAREALHEMQFGYVARPAHRSGAQEQSRYEVCNHHYTALCDHGLGFALLNDSKYGVSARDGAISLTLLRAAAVPEMRTDQGENTFTYAFTAWTGEFSSSGVVRQGYELNQPLLLGEGSAPRMSAFSVDHPGVVLETVKPAEDGSGDIILRLYESVQASADCALSSLFSLADAWACDMLENPLAPLPAQAGKLPLAFKPFEVKTVRLKG